MIHEYPQIDKILDYWQHHAEEMQSKIQFSSDPERWKYYLGMSVAIILIREDILKLVNKEAEEMEAYFRPLSDIMVGS